MHIYSLSHYDITTPHAMLLAQNEEANKMLLSKENTFIIARSVSHHIPKF